MSDIFLYNMIGFLCGCVLWYIHDMRQQKIIDKYFDISANLSKKLHNAEATIERLKTEITPYSQLSKTPFKEVLITTGGTGGGGGG